MNPLTFDRLRTVNAVRCRRWHDEDSTPWTSADWSNATAGEVGELADALEAFLLLSSVTRSAGMMANTVKKLRRAETGARNDGDPDEANLLRDVMDEAADVVIYLDLLTAFLGIDLGEAVADKFDRTSERYGYPERLR